MLELTGQTLVQVPVARAQLLQLPWLSIILYDHTVVHGSFIIQVKVIHVESISHQQVIHEYQAYQVLVVPPRSVHEAVKIMLFDSIAVPLILLAVGATLFQIHILIIHDHDAHWLS
jgi:hypothetical protein